jgi:hypothetical protein
MRLLPLRSALGQLSHVGFVSGADEEGGNTSTSGSQTMWTSSLMDGHISLSSFLYSPFILGSALNSVAV